MNIPESGVGRYVLATGTFEIGFPVDHKGKAYVACEYCRLFTGRKCPVTNEIILFPSTHIGNYCPLSFEGEQEE